MKKILICRKCGTSIVAKEKNETVLRSRIIKFQNDGKLCVVCKGQIGSGQQCKAKIEIPKKLILQLMKEPVYVKA